MYKYTLQKYQEEKKNRTKAKNIFAQIYRNRTVIN